MIKNRILYSLTLCGAFFLCYMRPGLWSSLLTYTLLILPIVSLIYCLLILKYFTYQQGLNEKFVTKGETIQYTFEICNEHQLIYPNLEVVFFGMDTILGKYFELKKVSIGAHQKKTFTYTMACNYRGYYQIGIESIYIIDFLALFAIPYRVFDPLHVTVYPRILPLEHLPFMNNVMEETSILKGTLGRGGQIVSDVRPYAYGDSIRLVHWKLSARMNELLVKNEERTLQMTTTLLIDLAEQDYELELKAQLEDTMIECLIAVSNYCLTQQIPHLCLYMKEKICRLKIQQAQDFDQFYRDMYHVKFESDVSLKELIQMNHEIMIRNENMILVIHVLDEMLFSTIIELKKHGHNVLVMCVRVDEDEDTMNRLRCLKEQGIQLCVIGVGTTLSPKAFGEQVAI